MNNEEIIEFNKRCAEFLNISKEYLDFYNNWNAIFEVIENIKNLKETVGNGIGTRMVTKFDITNIGVTIGFENGDFYGSIHIGHTDNGKYFKFDNDCDNVKEATIQAINKFLIWYKSI